MFSTQYVPSHSRTLQEQKHNKEDLKLCFPETDVEGDPDENNQLLRDLEIYRPGRDVLAKAKKFLNNAEDVDRNTTTLKAVWEKFQPELCEDDLDAMVSSVPKSEAQKVIHGDKLLSIREDIFDCFAKDVSDGKLS